MKLLQLTTIIRDAQTATMTAQTFTRAPVLVGRQYGNHLRLDARIVSRRQGAFLFSKDGLQYIDYASANGSYIDGCRVASNRPIDIRDGSVITIAPFQIVAHLDLVDAHRLSHDPNASTPVQVADNATALRRATALRESLELAQRATRVLAVVAECLVAASGGAARTPSPLSLASSPDEMIVLLLDPAGGDQRLTELRQLLAVLLRPRLTSTP
jgi:hypothetical protein